MGNYNNGRIQADADELFIACRLMVQGKLQRELNARESTLLHNTLTVISAESVELPRKPEPVSEEEAEARYNKMCCTHEN